MLVWSQVFYSTRVSTVRTISQWTDYKAYVCVCVLWKHQSNKNHQYVLSIGVGSTYSKGFLIKMCENLIWYISANTRKRLCHGNLDGLICNSNHKCGFMTCFDEFSSFLISEYYTVYTIYWITEYQCRTRQYSTEFWMYK